MAKFLSPALYEKIKNGTTAKDEKGNIVNKSLYDYLQKLAEFYDKWKGKIVVADLYQLAAGPDKAFSLDFKKIKHNAVKVEAEYVVIMNQEYYSTGKFYHVDEKATEEYQGSLASDIKRRQANDRKRKQVASALTELVDTSLHGYGEPEKIKPKKVKVFTVFGVDKNFDLFEDVTDEEKENFAFTGTEKECKDYIKAEKKKK